MSELLDETVKRLNQVHKIAYIMTVMIRLIRMFLYAALVFMLWAMVQPDAFWGQFFAAICVLVMAALMDEMPSWHKIKASNFLLHLDMSYPEETCSPYLLRSLNEDQKTFDKWEPHLMSAVDDQAVFERSYIKKDLTTLVLPFFLLMVILVFSPKTLSETISHVSTVVTSLTKQATITVLEGGYSKQQKKRFDIGTFKSAKIELMEKNLLEIKITLPKSAQVPRIDLKSIVESPRKGESSSVQSFQLAPMKQSNDYSNLIEYGLIFAAQQSAELFLSSQSLKTPVAIIKVHRLPVPQVRLALHNKDAESPWPDDKPLSLSIDVDAKTAIQWVRLVISAEGRNSKELVANVLNQNKSQITITHELLLETYLEQDLSQVSIVAEALDRSLPTPLLGESNALVLQTASAYGRYRRTLRVLSDLRKNIEEAISSPQHKINDKTVALTLEAQKKSEDSPFFDGLDRFQINEFAMTLRALSENKDFERLISLAENINSFLFEHEVLDDQERDRDFFVSVRMLSRFLEQPRSQRVITIKNLTNKINTFLDERQIRWRLRVERLPPELKPKMWGEIEGEIFHRDMNQIAALDRDRGDDGAREGLLVLTKTIASYRKWLQELETAEEKARTKRESNRQQGLADAREMLKQLQRTQDSISKSLDLADRRNPEIEGNWPSIRMEQNANIKGTSDLELKLKMLSPTAGERIGYALKSMREVADAGGGKEFVKAESLSDLAGRLLRQAESAAQKADEREQKQRGSRRRVSGDKYYGNQVIGGNVEIKHEYEVNRVYREDVIEDIQHYRDSTSEGKAYEGILNDYLREIVR